MLPVATLHKQTACNCGSYSLWMALESVKGAADAGLITSIVKGATMYSDSMGGIFNVVQMGRVVESVGCHQRKVEFHDTATFVAAVNNHAAAAILVAYSFNGLHPGGAGPFPPDEEAADSAHWSVLTAIAPGVGGVAGTATLANPHGSSDTVGLDQLVQQNMALKNSRFNWKWFVQSQMSTAAGASFMQAEMKKYKNDEKELTKRGRQRVDLGGYFLAITA